MGGFIVSLLLPDYLFPFAFLSSLPAFSCDIHVGVVALVFGFHIDFDFGTVHRRESRSEAQVVSIDANTYAKRTQPMRL